jgi:hypothetical protein
MFALPIKAIVSISTVGNGMSIQKRTDLSPCNKYATKAEIRSGSPNIPNLRTFTELIYTLRNNKVFLQIQKLGRFMV